MEIGELSRLGTFDLHSNQVSKTEYFYFYFVSNYSYYKGKELFYIEFRWNTGNYSYITIFASDAFVLFLLNSRLFDVLFIDFVYSQLKDYPVEACKLSLLVLNLSNNSLSGLPPEMGKFSKFLHYEFMIVGLVALFWKYNSCVMKTVYKFAQKI